MSYLNQQGRFMDLMPSLTISIYLRSKKETFRFVIRLVVTDDEGIIIVLPYLTKTEQSRKNLPKTPSFGY